LTWKDVNQTPQALKLIESLLQVYLPGKCMISLVGDASAGMTHRQKRNDAELIKRAEVSSGPTELSRLYNKYTYAPTHSAAPYAMIFEADAEYDLMMRADALLTWISPSILQRLGHPTGFELLYNDGIKNRLSGFTAHGTTEYVLLGNMSNHARIMAPKVLTKWLAKEGLLEKFNAAAVELGFNPLP
jgi:hypothetical protein